MDLKGDIKTVWIKTWQLNTGVGALKKGSYSEPTDKETQIENLPKAQHFAWSLVIYEKSSREWITEVMPLWHTHIWGHEEAHQHTEYTPRCIFVRTHTQCIASRSYLNKCSSISHRDDANGQAWISPLVWLTLSILPSNSWQLRPGMCRSQAARLSHFSLFLRSGRSRFPFPRLRI